MSTEWGFNRNRTCPLIGVSTSTCSETRMSTAWGSRLGKLSIIQGCHLGKAVHSLGMVVYPHQMRCPFFGVQFMLSYAEANKYFGVTESDRKNTKSRVTPTTYAKKQGAYTSSSYKTTEGSAAGWWWLRSPGYYQDFAATVYINGSLFYFDVSCASGCVRPALWVNLESGIF